MRSFRARLLALLTAAALVLPLGAFARASYFCRMLGRTVPSCCCGGHGKATSVAPEKQLRAEDCCQRISASPREATPSVLESTVSLEPAALVTVLPELAAITLREIRTVDSPIRARAPPALGPPLFIANCSLLS